MTQMPAEPRLRKYSTYIKSKPMALCRSRLHLPQCPMLNSGGYRNENIPDLVPDQGYGNQDQQGEQADENRVLGQVLTTIVMRD
jgi:hypothetical protein